MTKRSEPAVLEIVDLGVVRNAEFSLAVPRVQIRAGHITCVVGANGSGKTTLLEVVAGLIVPDSGTVQLAGQPTIDGDGDPYLKRLLGYVPDDEEWIIPELTAREYWALLSSIYLRAGVAHDTQQVAHILAQELDFTQAAQQLGSLSHGNIKKVQLIAGLMHMPQLIVVDELRNGLDPVAIKQAEGLLVESKMRGAAILVATHDLWWAERFASDIVMLRAGRVVLQDTTKRIVAEAGSVEERFMQLYGASA